MKTNPVGIRKEAQSFFKPYNKSYCSEKVESHLHLAEVMKCILIDLNVQPC